MRWAVWVGLVAVVVGGGAAGFLTRAPRTAPLSAPPAAPAEAPVRAADSPAAARDWLGVVLVGQDVDVAPKAEGRVDKVEVRPGDRVKRGAVLARMDVHAARASLRLAQASLADAEERLSRRSGMVAGVLSQEEISNAQVLVLEKRGRVEDLRALIGDADVRAPFDGVVSQRFLDPGAMASPGKPIVRLVGGREARVRFAIPEEQAGRVRPAARVQLQLKSLPQPLFATVASVAPEVDSAARMIFAVADIQVPPALAETLSAGMTARVSLPPGPADDDAHAVRR